nr:DUF4158 domain-containing protein [Streptomyces sp. MJP52]
MSRPRRTGSPPRNRPGLERFFFLDDVDRDPVALRRSTHHRPGFALQMRTVRRIGRFSRTIRSTCRGRWSSTWPRSPASRTRRW